MVFSARSRDYLRRFLLAVFFIFFWGNAPFSVADEENPEIYYDFFHYLESAEITSSRTDNLLPRKDRLNLQKDMRNFILQPAGVTITHFLELPQHCTFHFSAGMDMASWKETQGVDLSLWLDDGVMERTQLFSIRLNPKKNKDQWGWTDRSIDLSSYGGKIVSIEFVSSSPDNDQEFSRVGWGNPVLTKREEQVSPGVSIASEFSFPQDPAFVFLLIFDNLSQMEIGAYGNATARTPFFDRISRSSVLYNGSIVPAKQRYRLLASLFSGYYTANHSFRNRQGHFKDSIKTIASYLNDVGYRSCSFFSRKTTTSMHALFPDFHESVYMKDLTGTAMERSQDTSYLITAFHDYLEKHLHEKLFTLVYFGTSNPSIELQKDYTKKKKGSTADRNRSSNNEDGEKVQPVLTAVKGSSQWDKDLGNCIRQLNEWNLGDKSLLFVTSTGKPATALSETNRTEYQSIIAPALLSLQGQKTPFLRLDLLSGCDILPTLLDVILKNPAITVDGQSRHPFRNKRTEKTTFLQFVDQLPDYAAMLHYPYKINFQVTDDGHVFEIYNLESDPLEENDLVGENSFYIRYLQQEFLRSPLYLSSHFSTGK